jgi:hypothetical protein
MLRIEQIGNDGKDVKIKYSHLDSENGKLDTYNIKSNREPAPEFFKAWTGLKDMLPELMIVKGSLELRQISLKRESVASEQLEYKVQFKGSVYVEGGTDYQFTTGIREGFWDARDKNDKGEYAGTGKELSEAITKKVNAVIEATLAYINGASAQQNMFQNADMTDGADSKNETEETVVEN